MINEFMIDKKELEIYLIFIKLANININPRNIFTTVISTKTEYELIGGC